MKTSSAVNHGQRLMRLRQRLGLSQREMAREFDVTCGAINHWEHEAREIPGPVLKLIELYENYLEQEFDPSAHDEYLRTLSSSWSDRLATTVRSMTRLSPKQIKVGLESSLRSFLEGNLSKDVLRRKIQITLLKRSIESIGQMKGLPLKAAQILTYLSPGLAPELRQTLAELQYLRRPMPPTLAAKVIFEEFGRRPDELFSEWSPKPFAVASIGQVHEARLSTGERVAVKIQFPGVKKSIESDFRDLSFLQYIASLIKPLDRSILDHITEVVIDECDYERELENLEKFRALFKGDPDILIPRSYRDFTRNRVLTMDLIEGKSLPEFVKTSTQRARDRAGEIIWKFTMTSQLKHGLVNADAHPGNFIFLDNQVAFIDFGRVHEIDPAVAKSYRQFCVHVSLREKEKAREVAAKLPMIANAKTFDFDAFWEVMSIQQQHGFAGNTFRFSHDYIEEGMRATRTLPKDGLKLTNEILWCNCSSYGLWAIFAELGASARWGDLAVEILG